MKKIISILTVLVVFYFVSCDRIKDPIIKKSTVVGSNFITKNNFLVSSSKKTLLEDYTGMKCPNCPAAATTASVLYTQYTPSLVVIAVHAGNFAKPFGVYTADYRTDAGDAWNGTSGFGITSNPNGIINRKAYAPNGLIVYHTTWGSIIPMAQNDPLVVKLDVTTNYDTLIGALNTSVNAIFKAAYAPNTHISVVLTEDHIIGKQDNQGVEIDDYEFEHMLRGAVNGAWGTPLTTSAKVINDTVKVSFNDFNLKDLKYTSISPPAVKPYTVNDKNVSVVVFVYNSITREVLQVESVKIR
ncbi:MAG: Omp28-related outer membrane protein [Bacteroidota bacterium]|nr:Omp28-related outer membrane protein [Bacteroidota bacterium]MDP3143766.1 Omp28-related outer membrane protein [Bacteroidota bacterium]MDP3556979.1 Omp28-related outer membrane protein [Bacteroidota bacterium]